MVDFSKLKKIISKNNSERIQQALAITEAIKQIAVLERNLGIKFDIASSAVNEVAEEWNLTYSTVASKCTTQMNMSLKGFENLVLNAVNNPSSQQIITLNDTLRKNASKKHYQADCNAIDMYFSNIF
ncbi:MAG: hypothetical protein ACI4K5_01280 [Ruminococcus sp.]